MFGLPVSAGLPQGGLPGFDNSSSAESSAGPINVGGLTFAHRDSTDTLVMVVVVVVGVLAAAAILRR